MKPTFWVLLGLLLLAASGIFVSSRLGEARALSGTPIEAAPTLPPLSFTANDGTPRRLSDYRGKVVLLFFAFTACPDTCPFTLAALARSYESLGSPPDLKVVMVSVDPSVDTPRVLDAYVNKFNPSFEGLTAPLNVVGQLSSSLYAGFVEKEPAAHDDYIRVIDRQGRFRLVYNQERLSRQELHHDLPRILREF